MSFTWYGDVWTVDGKRPSEFRDADGHRTLPVGSAVTLLAHPLGHGGHEDVLAYARLDPSESYEITVEYDLHTWDTYLPPYGQPYKDKEGVWIFPRSEAFSVSVMGSAPERGQPGLEPPNDEYKQLLKHPLNFPGLGFVYGGSQATDSEETRQGKTTLVFPGSTTTASWLVLARTADEEATLPPAAAAPDWGNGVSGSASPHGRGAYNMAGPLNFQPDWGTFTISLRDLEATDLVRKPDGGATFAYSLSSDKIPNIPINFYWAKGEKKEDILGSLDQPLFDYILMTPERKAKGDHTGEIPREKLAVPPLGATHVIMWVDPKGAVDETDRDNNLRAMPLSGIAPLHIEVVGGDFEYDDKNKRHKAEGTMLIGLEPAAGQVFEPYVSLAGLAWYDSAILHMEGTFDLARGSFHPTLYQGVLEYQVGKAASKPVTGTPTPPPPENAFKVAGAGVHITGIRFGVDGLGLQGAIVLPDKFGGLQLLVQDRNWLLVDRNGDISLTGIKLSKKEFSITFFPKPPGEESKPDIVAKNMSVEWVAATATQPSKFVFRGEVSIPKMWDLTANFAGENYIQYANGQLDWKGRLSLGSLEIVKGRWELKEAYIEMDTIKQEYKGGGQMLIPAGFIVGGDVGFRKGRFNYVSVKVDDLNWPIGTTGWFLQRIKGEVDHLAKGGADPDPEPIAFGGGVSFSSFKFTVSESELSDVLEYFFDIDPGSQPPPEGGDEKQYEFGLAQIDVDAKIDEKRLTGDGKLYLLFMGDPSDPTKEPTAAVKATVNAEYDWIQQTLTAKGTFNLLGDLAVANGSLTVDKDGNVRIAGSGAAKLPNIPWTPLKGQTLGTGNLNARFTNDGDLTNDYVALWGTLDLGRVLGRQDVGVKIPFRGKTQFFGNLAELQRATASVSSVPQTLSASASPGDGYEIAPGTEKTVLYLEWENDVGPRAIEVVAPDGTVSSESQIAASADMSLVDAFCGATSKAVGILNPAAGVWRIRPVDSTGLGAVSSMGLGSSQPPTVTITGAYSLGNIRWTASDPDSPYHVDFFLDTDNTGADGVALTSSDGISFDRRDIPPGEYWVYAVANDGSNPPVIAYAPNSVTRKNSAPHFYGEWVGNPYFFYSVRAGDTLSTWVQAADYDPVGRPDHTSLLTFSLAPGAPPGASITPEGLLTYTTDPNRLGSYSVSITLQVTDGLPEALGPNSNTATIQVDVVGPHTVSGAIDEPDQSDAWHIAGLAGQQFVYTPAANTSASLQVTLTAPDGSVVYQGPANVSAPLAMTADGIYTVTISGEAAGDTGTYEFSLRQVIRAGEAVEDCFFDSQNKTVEYLFSATAGQMVFLQDLKTHRGHDLGSFGAQWDLVAPDGTKLSLEDMFVHGGGYRLDQSGQYRLRVTALGELVSWYSFRLADRAAATPVNAGEEVNFRFSDENDVHLFSYTGKAGDWIEIQNYDPRAGGRWWIGLPGAGRVFDPYGNRIGGDPSRLLLPEDSSLLLALRWTGIWYSTDGGKFRILRSVPQSQPLVFDQVLEDGGGFGPGQIQLEQFTFSGTAGQVVYYSELAQSPAIKTLLGPDGLVATWERDRLLVLPTTGDYSLYINRQYNHRAFKMTDVSALPSLARDTWIADMSPPAGPGLVNIYRYHGTQGEAIHLRMKESTFRTPWIIFGPDGNVLAADGDDFSAYLPATGDYTLTFPGYYGLWGKEAGYPYEFQLTNDAVRTPVPLTLGSKVEGSVGAGEHHAFQFNGTAGQRLLLKTNWGGNVATARIFAPNNAWLHDGYLMDDSTILELPETGQYTLILELPSAQTSPYEFTLIDVGSVPALLAPNVETGVLRDEFDQRWYTFTGQAGQTITVDDGMAPGYGGGTKSVLGSQFQIIACAGLGEPLETTLPETGTYYLVLTGGASSSQGFEMLTTVQTPVNHPPVAQDDTAMAVPNTPATIDVLANDRDDDDDAVSLILAGAPSHGTLETLADGALRYSPLPDYHGADQFTYKLSDGAAESGVATVTIIVNGPPATAGDPFSVDEDGTLVIPGPGVLANDTDAEQDAMTVLVAAPPSHGSFVANPNGSFTYAPDRNFNGVDTWSYRASDGWNLSDETLVRITVRPVNDPPSASPRGFVLDQGLPAAIGLAVDDGDPEVAQAFTLTVVAPPEHGDLSDFDPFTGEVTYTPRGAYFGPDQFSFTVTDDAQAGAPAGATSDLAAVTLQVAPRVSLPAASKDTSFLLKRNGSHVQLVNTRTKKPVFDASGDRVYRLTVLGAAGKAETLSIDPSAIVAGSGLQGGVIFDGLPGGKGDVLVLRGTAKRDTFHLGPGAATVNGLDIQSPDVEQLIFDGGAENDTYQIAGLSTSVTIVDNKGIDLLDFSQAAAGVNVDLNKSRGQVQEIFAATSATLALKGTLETVIGTPQGDVLRGNSLANKIWGGAGDDTIYGGGGYDLLYGEDGDDWLYGDADNDLLFGGLGSNVLVGGDGNDILDASGSPGRGLLIGGKGSDRLTASRGDCILIGGATSYDAKAAALAAVTQEWESDKSYDARRDRLDAGFDHPLAGFIQLKRKTKTNPAGTVIDDRIRDQFFGGAGNNWFLSFSDEVS